MFEPPCCPHPDCTQHDRPEPGFFHRSGSYVAACRNTPVPRFRCRTCRRTFSRQTFRADRRDHKPWLNTAVAQALVSGTGQRQIARILGIHLTTVQRKLRKIGEHCRALCRTLTGSFGGDLEVSFDELETFEGCRATRPLTVAIAVVRWSGYLIASCAAPIPPSGRMTDSRRARIARERDLCGPRPNRSKLACRIVFRMVRRATERVRSLEVHTDQKRTYPAVLRKELRGRRYRHCTVSSRAPRDRKNPLFWSNLTNAMSRDNLGRLHRRSWLVSKKKRWLEHQLAIFHAYRNFVRARTNGDERTPAMVERFTHRPCGWGDLLSWRQDHGPPRSIHPLSPWHASATAYREELAGSSV